jgi:type IV pilus assembly protein PilO
MERSRPQKIGAWVGSLLLIGTTFWFYLYGDVRERVVQLKERHADLTTQIAKERALAKNLEGFRAEVQQLDADLRVALLELPDKKEIPDLLKSMSTLANQSGLE